MADELPNPPPPADGRLSLRLPRPLCIGLVAALLILALVGMQLGVPIYNRCMALREIERLGGKIETRKGGPDWLRQWLGDKAMRYFDSDRQVDLSGTNFSDADAGNLVWLIDVESLDLHDSQVTDAGLSHLQRCDGLRHLVNLDLRNCAVSDRGLSHLSGMSSLSSINLGSVMVGSGWPDGRQITDAGVVHLRGLSNLENLDLNGTMVTDACLGDVSRLTNLTHLWLASTDVTDAGIAQIRKLPRLEVLCLRGSRVSTAGIRELKTALPRLYVMDEYH